MAQVIKINNLHSIPGADRLMVTYLAPMNLPVVVSMFEFNLAMYAIFLPVGTKLPDDLRSLASSENGVIELKIFFGQPSQGVLIPFACLPQEFRRENTPEQLRLCGRNVGDVLGCTSVNGTAHFGGFGGNLMAELNNTTGEVVGLFSDGQVLLSKLGQSNLVGPLAPQGVLINPPAATPNEADIMMARLDEFAGYEDELLDLGADATALWRETRDQLRAMTPANDKDVSEGIIAGYKLASNEALDAVESGLVTALGAEVADKLIPYLTAQVAVALAVQFEERLEVLGEMVAEEPAAYHLTEKGREYMTAQAAQQAALNQCCQSQQVAPDPKFCADGCC